MAQTVVSHRGLAAASLCSRKQPTGTGWSPEGSTVCKACWRHWDMVNCHYPLKLAAPEVGKQLAQLVASSIIFLNWAIHNWSEEGKVFLKPRGFCFCVYVCDDSQGLIIFLPGANNWRATFEGAKATISVLLLPHCRVGRGWQWDRLCFNWPPPGRERAKHLWDAY